MTKANLGLIILAATIFLTGCHSVIEAREDSDYCEIHHTPMRSEAFSPPSNSKPPSQEYVNARVRYFRHSYPSMLQPHAFKKYMIYVCDQCVKVEAEWLRLHPEYKR